MNKRTSRARAARERREKAARGDSWLIGGIIVIVVVTAVVVFGAVLNVFPA